MTLYRADTVYQRVKGMRREQQTLVGVNKELCCQRNKERTTLPGSPRNGRRAANIGSVSLGFFNRGPASLASQTLYLMTMQGKSLTRPFPGVAIEQRVWSARLGFGRSSIQRDLSMPQCIPLTLRKGGILDPCRVGQIQKIWRGGT